MKRASEVVPIFNVVKGIEVAPAAVHHSEDHRLEPEQQTLNSLEQHLVTKAGLAVYAVPRFVRVIVDVGEDPSAGRREQLGIADRESVGTEYVSLMMKKLKTSLRKDGFVLPAGSRDRMYYIPREGQGYVVLNDKIRQELVGGRARL